MLQSGANRRIGIPAPGKTVTSAGYANFPRESLLRKALMQRALRSLHGNVSGAARHGLISHPAGLML